MQCKPSNFVAHNFDDKHSSMRCCCRMNTIDRICRNIHCALESKSDIRSPDIIVNRLWQSNYIAPLFMQKVCCFVCAITTQDNKTIQFPLLIIGLHRLHFVQAIFIRSAHFLKWLTRCANDRATLRQNTREIFWFHLAIVAIDQTLVAFQNTIDLYIRAVFI